MPGDGGQARPNQPLDGADQALHPRQALARGGRGNRLAQQPAGQPRLMPPADHLNRDEDKGHRGQQRHAGEQRQQVGQREQQEQRPQAAVADHRDQIARADPVGRMLVNDARQQLRELEDVVHVWQIALPARRANRTNRPG